MGSIKRRLGYHCSCGASTWIILERTLLLFMLQAVGVYCSGLPANLTVTDAYPVLGGYVVPVNGNITLHCEAQGPPYKRNTDLQWNLAIGTYSRNETHAAVIAAEPSNRFSHLQPDVNNPAILRIHNLQISENGSTVQCLVTNLPDTLSQVITIYVEDIPNCVENLDISSKFNDTSYVVSWNRYNGQFPVTYNMSIWSTGSEVVVLESTEHPLFHLDSNVYHLSNTTYFVLITTCNGFGCSQDCNNTTIQPGALQTTDPESNPTKVPDKFTSLPSGTLAIIIVVPVAVALFVFILMAIVLLSWCIIWRIQGKNKQRDHQEEHFTIENRCNLKSQTICQNGTMEEYATVSDAKEKRHLPSSPLSVQSSTPQNVVDMEGYGVVQNVAKTPQKVRSVGSQRHRVMSDVPEPMHYAEVNGCCTQNKLPISRSHSNPPHQTVTTPTTPLPPEYAEVPDTIRIRPPVQRLCSIPTASSIEEGPPIPPRGYIQSPENLEVMDAGYGSLPHQNTPSRVTKVRSSKQGGSGSLHSNPEGTVA